MDKYIAHRISLKEPCGIQIIHLCKPMVLRPLPVCYGRRYAECDECY